MVCLSISGCAGFPHNLPPQAKELAASLAYVAGDKPLEPGSGIVSVGNYYFPDGYPRIVHLAPGEREVGFYCPGQIYVDGPPTITYDFVGGQSYELFCRKGQGHIRVAQPVAAANHPS
ncbi:hypothetical protein [Fulvimonas yonginensis]|uniref:Lipoprotein n=1 Tax=Fulvimonas yonginensis TaxID=1495200 RepID=A0ABU8JHI9_9GAMM